MPTQLKRRYRRTETQVNDIRPLKQKLRAESKLYRNRLSEQEKRLLDSKISNRFFNTWQYRDCKVLLTYVSTAIEVDTHAIIARALSDKKRVAVPKCIDNTRLMDFYFINGFDDLESGFMGVLEPVPERCEKLTDFSDGLCIVPALMFDEYGYRLGYGKGYYDRFLSNFCGETLGICYNSCIKEKLPHGKFDKCVEKIITQSKMITAKGTKGGGVK